MKRRSEDSSARGQVLVIVAVGMIGFVAMVGLVIDGGYAWGRQRDTQNGADAVAKAGTVVVQQYLALQGTPTDGDVGCAVEAAATANEVDVVRTVYTDDIGTILLPETEVGPCNPGAGAAIPSGAQGVKAVTSQDFGTFLVGVVGVNELHAQADATAVVGEQVGICPADSGCGALPVTFPHTAVVCDGTNRQILVGSSDWPILDEEELTPDNMSIIPLCSTNAGDETPGSVGWLDFDCGNLADTIADPCQFFINIPAWLATQTGNVNNVEDELNQYAGPLVDEPDPDDQTMTLPIHTNTCESKPLDDDPVCPEGDWSGTGNNVNYYIPYWVGFKIDQAYIQGDNRTECNSPPGNPSDTAGSGATSCLKGWFIDRFESPGTISTGRIEPGDPVPMGILLID